MILSEETKEIFSKINLHKDFIMSNKAENKEDKNIEISNQFFKVKNDRYDISLIEKDLSNIEYFKRYYNNPGFKYLNDLYIGLEKNKKFAPKILLSLYTSTNNLLNKYLNNNFTNETDLFKEIAIDILSLLFYLKIPIIAKNLLLENYKEDDIVNSIIFILDDLFRIIKLSKFKI